MVHRSTVRLDVGTRVRHTTQQWESAYRDGTATIVEVLGQDPDYGYWKYRVLLDAGVYREWESVDVASKRPEQVVAMGRLSARSGSR